MLFAGIYNCKIYIISIFVPQCITASEDSFVRVWELRSGQTLEVSVVTLWLYVDPTVSCYQENIVAMWQNLLCHIYNRFFGREYCKVRLFLLIICHIWLWNNTRAFPSGWLTAFYLHGSIDFRLHCKFARTFCDGHLQVSSEIICFTSGSLVFDCLWPQTHNSILTFH